MTERKIGDTDLPYIEIEGDAGGETVTGTAPPVDVTGDPAGIAPTGEATKHLVGPSALTSLGSAFRITTDGDRRVTVDGDSRITA